MQDSTWGIRLAVGLVGLVYLAAIDWYKNPKNPTRIKEYGFLFGVTGLAMVHGLVHDFFTHAVSSEYFSVGKGMGPRGDAFGPDVALLALQASWSVGLLIGLVLLVANNPSKKCRQLDYVTLCTYLWIPWLFSTAAAILLGCMANLFAEQFIPLIGLSGIGLVDETGFLTVWAVHAGSYIGAIAALIIAAIKVRKRRALLACSCLPILKD